MENKKMSWTIQEDKVLTEFRNDQILNNSISWSKISVSMNLKFGVKKTAKQCRQRYMNYLKFGDQRQASPEWTASELNLFTDLIIQHGSSWILICHRLQTKSENFIKNKFHNSLRKACNALHDVNVKFFNAKKKSIEPNLLLAMIDIATQTRFFVKSKGYTPNQNCMLFQFRKDILKFSLENEEFPIEMAISIVKQIKNLNLKLKCFGIFKVKNRKHWKVTAKTMEAILSFDDVMLQKNVKFHEEKSQCITQEQQQIGEIEHYNLEVENQKYLNSELINNFQFNFEVCKASSGDLLGEANEILGIIQNFKEFADNQRFLN